jgi:hypothetical protein
LLQQISQGKAVTFSALLLDLHEESFGKLGFSLYRKIAPSFMPHIHFLFINSPI